LFATTGPFMTASFADQFNTTSLNWWAWPPPRRLR